MGSITIRIFNLLLAYILSSAYLAYGQKMIFYETILANNVTCDGKLVSNPDKVFPGDSLLIGEGGKLGLISNYYHTLEYNNAGWIVLPDFSINQLSEFWERPGLENVLDTLRFYKGQPVKAGLNYMKMYWPDESPHGSKETPCVMWHFNDWNKEYREYDTDLLVLNMYHDSLGGIREAESPLILNDFLENSVVRSEIEEKMLVFIEVRVQNPEGLFETEQAPLLFSVSDVQIRPQDPCTAQTALEFFAIALYLENNFSPREEVTDWFYLKMKKIGKEDVFRLIWEKYTVRRKK